MMPRTRVGLLGLLGASVACLIVTGCVIRGGSNPAILDVAQGPRGVLVTVDWRGSNDLYVGDRAELLAVGETGVYLLHDERVVFYPLGVRASLRPYRSHGVPAVDLEDVTPLELSEISTFARYPFGLEASLLEGLMDTLGQDSALVRREP